MEYIAIQILALLPSPLPWIWQVLREIKDKLILKEFRMFFLN